MSIITKILEKVETKERKWLECSKCKGSGLLMGFMHVQHGKCFKCFGKGKVPNKWLGIEIMVKEFQAGVLETKKYIEGYEAAQMKSAKQGLERGSQRWYDHCLLQIQGAKDNHRRQAREKLAAIAKKAGVL